jgi:hypothetical protein
MRKRNETADSAAHEGRRSDLTEDLNDVGRNHATSHDYEANNPDEDDERCVTSKLMLGSSEPSQRMPDPDGGQAEVQHTACCALDGIGLRLSPFLLLLIFIYCNLLNFVDR